MIRLLSVFAIAVALAGATPARVAAQFEGTWKLSYVSLGTTEQAIAIIKVKVENGKATGELIASNPRLKVELKSVSQGKDGLTVVMKSGATDLSFQTAAKSGADKRFGASLAAGSTLYPGLMTPADNQTELEAKDLVRTICPPAQQARTLASKSLSLRFKAQQTKDAEQRKDLLKQAAEADAAAKKETPALYREVLAKYGDTPAVFDAALNLLRSARTSDAKPEDVKSWAATAAMASGDYGSRFQSDFAGQVAGVLLGQDGMEELALVYARQGEAALTPTTSAEQQVRVLTLLTRALSKAGKDQDAKPYFVRIAKLDEVLDREYSKTMPPFKGTAFKGRTGKSERAVFLELFTGATCPPCVAADLAFDVLTKTYKPSELVLIQYHIHVPGPDPMTNPDTEARWKYYTKAYPTQVRGVPSSIFNGKPAAGGGGGVANSEAKYDKYRDVIDPLLDEPAGAKLAATATRKGDRIDIDVAVSDLAGPGRQKKLRILLAEETIRYAGSNKIRFHHNVVRAFPGGVAGKLLLEPNTKHQASIDLGTLRGDLNKYLDDYQANVRPFANPARPLEFSHLRVIAFVQDDSSHEILQAVQVNVDGK